MKKVTISITFDCPKNLIPFLYTLESNRFPSGYELAHIQKYVKACDAFTKVIVSEDVSSDDKK